MANQTEPLSPALKQSFELYGAKSICAAAEGQRHSAACLSPDSKSGRFMLQSHQIGKVLFRQVKPAVKQKQRQQKGD